MKFISHLLQNIKFMKVDNQNLEKQYALQKNHQLNSTLKLTPHNGQQDQPQDLIQTEIIIDIKDNSSDDLKTAGISDMYQQIHENQIQQLKKLGKKPHEIAMELKAYSLREFNDLIEKTLRSRGFHKQKGPSTITIDIDLNEISSMALGYADIIDNLEQGLPNRYRKKFKPKQEFNQSALQIENILKDLIEVQKKNPVFVDVVYITNHQQKFQTCFQELQINIFCLPSSTDSQYNLFTPNGSLASLFDPMDIQPPYQQIKLADLKNRIRIEIEYPCKFKQNNSNQIYLTCQNSQEVTLEVLNLAYRTINLKFHSIAENEKVIEKVYAVVINSVSSQIHLLI